MGLGEPGPAGSVHCCVSGRQRVRFHEEGHHQPHLQAEGGER